MPTRLHLSRLGLVTAMTVGCGSQEYARPPGGDAVGHITVVRPAERLTLAPGVPVSIEWVSTVAGATTVDLLADADGDPETTSDQIPLVLGTAAATALTVFDWRTADVPLGRYRVLARMHDRKGTHVSMAPGVVEIVEPLLKVENLEEGERLVKGDACTPRRRPHLGMPHSYEAPRKLTAR
ncbi:hypothetical protein HUA78_02255 [Myxococcus sp. CA033]|uniref:hypothetical protein n=1 Tax=Myxococcus sp. CA033 TaxID=2741516 RepID=UPI00157A4ED3|nr:hypothetical protein [Myxococcus sp. CA033]NTX33251.1 hypothetical protein [Myxococcus sp. CA033]